MKRKRRESQNDEQTDGLLFELMEPENLELLMKVLGVILVAGILGFVLPYLGVKWTWPLMFLLVVSPIWLLHPLIGATVTIAGLVSTAIAWRSTQNQRRAGGDIAARIDARPGPLAVARRLLARRGAGRVMTSAGLLVGHDSQHQAVRVPVGERTTHTLVLGATGAGKTVTQAWMLGRAVDAGFAVVCVDPKGDPLLMSELHAAAQRNGRRFSLWTPEGPCSYNPFAHGSHSELADKALAGETYTEPHYLRQAQRYVAQATRTLQAAGQPVTLWSLVSTLDPDELEKLARPLPEDRAVLVHSYVDSLTGEQRRGLAGTRDRLAILAESELGVWLGEYPEGIDLRREIASGGVVYLRLDADRWPLLAEMLAAAIVQDLITVAAHHQATPAKALVCLDEFSAVAPEQVVRLLGRARSAGLSLVLGTQEVADLESDRHPGLLQQVLGNAATIIAHRQRVPDSAELLARVAGTRGSWTHTQRTHGLVSGRDEGTRTRAREFHIHPEDFKTLAAGEAVVITDDGRPPRRARMLHPRKARVGR